MRAGWQATVATGAGWVAILLGVALTAGCIDISGRERARVVALREQRERLMEEVRRASAKFAHRDQAERELNLLVVQIDQVRHMLGSGGAAIGEPKQ